MHLAPTVWPANIEQRLHLHLHFLLCLYWIGRVFVSRVRVSLLAWPPCERVKLWPTNEADAINCRLGIEFHIHSNLQEPWPNAKPNKQTNTQQMIMPNQSFGLTFMSWQSYSIHLRLYLATRPRVARSLGSLCVGACAQRPLRRSPTSYIDFSRSASAY